MTRILTSSAGQQYAVDDEFDLRLDLHAGVDWVDTDGDELVVRATVADLLDFFSAEGLI